MCFHQTDVTCLLRGRRRHSTSFKSFKFIQKWRFWVHFTLCCPQLLIQACCERQFVKVEMFFRHAVFCNRPGCPRRQHIALKHNNQSNNADLPSRFTRFCPQLSQDRVVPDMQRWFDLLSNWDVILMPDMQRWFDLSNWDVILVPDMQKWFDFPYSWIIETQTESYRELIKDRLCANPS